MAAGQRKFLSRRTKTWGLAYYERNCSSAIPQELEETYTNGLLQLVCPLLWTVEKGKEDASTGHIF